MQLLTGEITKLVTEVIIVLLGAFGSIALAKAKTFLDGLGKKYNLAIINQVTDSVVHYAEAELSGAQGIDKRNFAVKKAVSILASKGIAVNEDEIIAGIEEGVNKLRANQLNIQSIAANLPAQQPIAPATPAPQAVEAPESKPEAPASAPVSK